MAIRFPFVTYLLPLIVYFYEDLLVLLTPVMSVSTNSNEVELLSNQVAVLLHNLSSCFFTTDVVKMFIILSKHMVTQTITDSGYWFMKFMLILLHCSRIRTCFWPFQRKSVYVLYCTLGTYASLQTNGYSQMSLENFCCVNTLFFSFTLEKCASCSSEGRS